MTVGIEVIRTADSYPSLAICNVFTTYVAVPLTLFARELIVLFALLDSWTVQSSNVHDILYDRSHHVPCGKIVMCSVLSQVYRVMASMINTLLHGGPLTRLFLHGTANHLLPPDSGATIEDGLLGGLCVLCPSLYGVVML